MAQFDSRKAAPGRKRKGRVESTGGTLRRTDALLRLVVLLLVTVCLGLTACASAATKTSKGLTGGVLEALNTEKSIEQQRIVRDRLQEAIRLWSEAAVRGAMNGWADPAAQEQLRAHSARLASEVTNAAVDGALQGVTNETRVAELERRLEGLFSSALVSLRDGMRQQIAPQARAVGRSAVSGFSEGLRDDLGPALRSALRDQVAQGVAEGLRDQIGPALRQVLETNVAPAIEGEIAASFATAIERSVEAPLLRVLDRAELLTNQVGDTAAETSRKVAWALGIMLAVVLGFGAFAWLKVKHHADSMALLTKAIKDHENEPAVRRLIEIIRTTGRGTAAGDNLDSFLKSRPTLRAHSSAEPTRLALLRPESSTESA